MLALVDVVKGIASPSLLGSSAATRASSRSANLRDVASAMERLLDPTDPMLDWDEIRGGPLMLAFVLASGDGNDAHHLHPR